MWVERIIFWSRRIQISKAVGSNGKLVGSRLAKAVAAPDMKIMSRRVKIIPSSFFDNSFFSSRILSFNDEICNKYCYNFLEMNKSYFRKKGLSTNAWLVGSFYESIYPNLKFIIENNLI